VGFIVKFVLLAVFGAFFVAIVAVVVGGLLVVTGSPDTCSDREVPVSEVIAAELDERWDQFSTDIAAAAASIDITESEATSRARQYIEDEDVPMEDLRVYFCNDGKGQLAGKVKTIGVDFVVTGHLDLSGEHPVVELDSIDVGNMPDFVADRVFDLLLDDDDRTLELDEHLVGSEIIDGLIIISGEP
jgi:hypothetical protein